MFAPEDIWEQYLTISSRVDGESEGELRRRAEQLCHLCEETRRIAVQEPTQELLMSSWEAIFLARAAWLYFAAGDLKQAAHTYRNSLAVVENFEVRANYIELLCQMDDLTLACIECSRFDMSLVTGELASTARQILTILCNHPSLALAVDEQALRACLAASGRDGRVSVTSSPI